MPDQLYRNAREWFSWPITATDSNGDPVTLTEVDIAIVPAGATPRSATTYTTVPVTGGCARRLLAGPDAAGSGAAVLPVGTSRPWFRITSGPEVVIRPGPPIVVPRTA
jgi:hypothetical protein